MTKVVTGTYDEDGNRTVLVDAVKAFGSDGSAPIVTTPELVDELFGAGDTFGGQVKDAMARIGAVEPVRIKMREWVGEAHDVVLLVHPRDGETVVDTLRRHFEAAGMGTVTVATADGPRDVDVPVHLAGVAVIESTLVPAGEIRLQPRSHVAFDVDVVVPPSAADLAGKLVLK